MIGRTSEELTMATVAVLTTIDSLGQARAIANMLVERRLAACVQISPIESIYTWHGAVQREDEYRLFAKTTEERYREVEIAICELHSYDVPAVYAVDLSHVYTPYADWVAENSSPGKI
jgi:periplasmic divalent cation tolerance protein